MLAERGEIAQLTQTVEKVKNQYASDLSKLNAMLSIESQLLEKRRETFEEIVKSMLVFIDGQTSSEEAQLRFSEAYATAWLWASDKVIGSLNNFIDLQVRFRNDSKSISQEELKTSYQKCVEHLRKHSGWSDSKLNATEYRFFAWEKKIT